MNNLPLQFVLDASVGIKLFLDEDYSDKVHTLFAGLSNDPPTKLFVPDLFYIECTNILLKYTRRFGRSLEDSYADVVDLCHLSLRAYPTVELMADSLMLAAQYDLTAYDACYAALAYRLELPLLTADTQLANIFKAQWIGDLNL